MASLIDVSTTLFEDLVQFVKHILRQLHCRNCSIPVLHDSGAGDRGGGRHLISHRRDHRGQLVKDLAGRHTHRPVTQSGFNFGALALKKVAQRMQALKH
ncbi:hypothetical protein [Mycobacterium intracellulare]|uniref:hypothetical protein n=1 Tax=Mycobacterium intracellulare TaxID=1767 RepID=UPI0005B4F2D7|nr:hypothetical protein [Mycobacterium intracellulare]